MKSKYSRELSDKELLSVLALGVTDEKVMAQEFGDICRIAFGNNDKYAQKKHFNKYLKDGQLFGDVHPILQEFIGAYTIASVEIPQWFKSFKNDLIMWICDKIEEHNTTVNEEIGAFDGDKTALSKQALKIIELIEQINHITPESFDAGKLNNGNKIIKSIISAIEVGIGKKDLQPEQTTWYKSYQANKLEGGGKNITITNANIAKIGISSLFSGHSASSCQKIEANTISGSQGYYDSIFTNITDETMVVMFEEGAPIHMYCNTSQKVKYTSMKWRSMIRLIKFQSEVYECACGTLLSGKDVLCCNCNGEHKVSKFDGKIKTMDGYGIMFDAFYPNAQDFKQAYAVVKDIADQIGIPIVMSKRNHYTQTNSQTKISFDCGDEYIGFFTNIEGISATQDCKGCTSVKKVSTCSSCKPISDKICLACKKENAVTIATLSKCSRCVFQNKCTITDCTDCPATGCKTYTPRSPYFDQLSGRSKFNITPNKRLEFYDTFSIMKGVK